MRHLLKRARTILAPALEHPVLVIESDDWGPGPETHALALEQIRSVLKRHTDRMGRHPVMTIGVVLSIPDMPTIQATGSYAARYLHEPDFRPLVEVLKQGAREKLFYLQLHGLAHYWPDNLMAELDRNPALAQALAEEPWHTEKLPSWLQSRWLDARRLPSRTLSGKAVETAVDEEIREFRRCFGFAPHVVVPPTFLWTSEVEGEYARQGVEVLITPGRRYTGRDEKGNLAPPDREEVNGRRLPSGLTTLVRDLYFEPAMGHTAEKLLPEIGRKWSRREPALLETHRFNFTSGRTQASLDSLDTLIRETLRTLPETRFLHPREVARLLRQRRPVPPWQRIQAAWHRMHA